MPGRLSLAALGLAAAAAVALLLWIASLSPGGKIAVEARIPAIMGTETVLKAVVPKGEDEARPPARSLRPRPNSARWNCS